MTVNVHAVRVGPSILVLRSVFNSKRTGHIICIMESLHEVVTDNNEMHERGVGSKVADEITCGRNSEGMKWVLLGLRWINILGRYVSCSFQEEYLLKICQT